MPMIPLFAIPIIGNATGATTAATSYFAQPIDAILFDILIWFGWIPILITLIWGFSQIWLDYRRGKGALRNKFIVLAIDVPAMTEQSPKALENLFGTLYACKSSITFKEKWLYGKLNPKFSFEIVSTEGYIQFLIRFESRFRDVIEAGIYAHYPDAEIAEVEDYTEEFPKTFPNETHEMWGGEITFDKPSMYPIRTYVDFEDRLSAELKDPLAYVLEQMAKMKAGEHFWIQIIIEPSTNSWKDAGVDHVKAIYGDIPKPKKSKIAAGAESLMSWPNELLKEGLDVDLSGLLFGDALNGEDDPWKVFKLTLPQIEEAKAILQKSTKVGHGVKIRVLYVAKHNCFVKGERTAIVKGIMNQYAHLNFNRFGLHIPSVPKDDYFWMKWSYTKRQNTLMKAYCSRSWGVGADQMWMNVEELATLWHFPAIQIKAPLVKKAEAKRAEPPVGLPITDLEDTLPGYKRTTEDEGLDLPGQRGYSAGIATAGSLAGEPPMGLPGVDLEEGPSPENLPSTISPTSTEVAEPEQVIDIPEPPEPTDQVDPLEFSESVLPDVKAPTDKESEEELKDDDETFVPPNLPV